MESYPPRAVVVALSGPSGSGKSTLTHVLAHRFGWVRLDEAYDRLLRRPSLEFASQAELTSLELRFLDEEARRYREARALAGEGWTVVADTGFLDPVAYTAGLFLEGEASERTLRAVVARAASLAAQGELGLPDLTVYLSVSSATRRARGARDPVRHPPALRSRHERVGRFDARVVRACLELAAPGRVLGVRVASPPGEVALRIGAVVRGATPLPDPGGAATRALEALVRRPALRLPSPSSGNLKLATLSPRTPR